MYRYQHMSLLAHTMFVQIALMDLFVIKLPSYQEIVIFYYKVLSYVLEDVYPQLTQTYKC